MDYDDIDDEIPLAVSKQALKMIESSESVKKEIIERNKDTATKLANSFIGKMLRRRGEDIDDEASVPSKKCRSSICDRKISSNDPTMPPKPSHKAESLSFFHRIQNKLTLTPPAEKIVEPSPADEICEEVFEEG